MAKHHKSHEPKPERRRLTPDEVRLARAAHAESKRLRAEANKLSIPNLAKKFGIAESSMNDILNYKTYRDIP